MSCEWSDGFRHQKYYLNDFFSFCLHIFIFIYFSYFFYFSLILNEGTIRTLKQFYCSCSLKDLCRHLQSSDTLFLMCYSFQDGRLTGGFLLLQNLSVAISVSPHVCSILVLILISMFLR